MNEFLNKQEKQTNKKNKQTNKRTGRDTDFVNENDYAVDNDPG